MVPVPVLPVFRLPLPCRCRLDDLVGLSRRTSRRGLWRSRPGRGQGRRVDRRALQPTFPLRAVLRSRGRLPAVAEQLTHDVGRDLPVAAGGSHGRDVDPHHGRESVAVSLVHRGREVAFPEGSDAGDVDGLCTGGLSQSAPCPSGNCNGSTPTPMSFERWIHSSDSAITAHEPPVASCQEVRSRVITEQESPADEPRTASRARAKSPVDNPCRKGGGHRSPSATDHRGPDDRGSELRLLSRLLLDPPVVYPPGSDRTRPGDGLHASSGLPLGRSCPRPTARLSGRSLLAGHHAGSPCS
jgi:hypothetical protein